MRLHSGFVAAAMASFTSICVSQTPPTPLTTERVAVGLSRPVHVASPPGDQGRLFIVEQHTGLIKILNLKTGVINAVPFLEIGGLATRNEQGLLGFAFHPDFARNGFFYVYFTASSRATFVVRYTVSAGDPDIADPASAHTIITIARAGDFHNGGWIGFSPNDGHLYIASGDGGDFANAQDITNNLLGKMLRLDPDGDDFPADPNRNYAIPPTNPFVGVMGDDEIWAYGIRNPWRASFDRLTGDLFFGDVGQDRWEELNFQRGDSTGGENYGWPCWEANQTIFVNGCPPQNTLVFPIHEYGHNVGLAITGGYVYRGCAIPDLQGTYIFADYRSATIWSFRFDPDTGVITEFTDRTAELQPGGGPIARISSFSEGVNGELYICNLRDGEILKIIPDGVPPVPCVCYADCDQSTGVGVLDLFDFICFQNSFVNGEAYACDCDTTTGPLVCDLFDFLCFQNEFVSGCP